MTEPGYKAFRIAPMPGGGLTWAKVSHVSPYGKIIVHWEIKDHTFILNATIPEGTTAEILLPDGSRDTYTAGEYTLHCAI